MSDIKTARFKLPTNLKFLQRKAVQKTFGMIDFDDERQLWFGDRQLFKKVRVLIQTESGIYFGVTEEKYVKIETTKSILYGYTLHQKIKESDAWLNVTYSETEDRLCDKRYKKDGDYVFQLADLNMRNGDFSPCWCFEYYSFETAYEAHIKRGKKEEAYKRHEMLWKLMASPASSEPILIF
jgi:hypothetical protein